MSMNKIYQYILLLLLLNNIYSYYYSSCEQAYKDGDAEALLEELRKITAEGKPGSYSDLWDTYVSAFVKDDGYIKDYYSSYSKYTGKDRDKGSGGTEEGQKYNREHSIPKSWWGGATSNQGADPFIVIPADKFVNNKRSSYPLGKVSRAKYSSYNDYSKLGEADTSYGYSGTVFEPNDDVKGDLARIVFYSIAKYETSYKWTSGSGSVVYSGDKNKNFGLTDYAVKLFTKWHEMDPPDEWEINLNNRLFEIQGNKNPFIDHPEYVNVIWGNSGKNNINKNMDIKDNKKFSKFLHFSNNN